MALLGLVNRGYSISVNAKIASGGEGDVWSTNMGGMLAKIYHSPNDRQIAKLKYMLLNPPVDPMAGKEHISIAWPIDLLRDLKHGGIVGFLMPGVSKGKTLVNVYNPQQRAMEAPALHWQHLHVIAQNVAAVVEAIHHKGYVIGDLKPQNLLIPQDTVYVSVVDTDSFQISDVSAGVVYRCAVCTAEYRAPELYGQEPTKTIMSETHDRFSLGVIIYMLLFGEHPFSGVVEEKAAAEEFSSLDRRISEGFWSHAPDSPVHPRPLSVPLRVAHPSLQDGFRRCFTLGHEKPHVRPSASEWKKALYIARKDVRQCATVKSHWFCGTYGKCCWCEIRSAEHLDFFPEEEMEKGGVLSAWQSAEHLDVAREQSEIKRNVGVSPGGESVRSDAGPEPIVKRRKSSGVWLIICIIVIVVLIAVLSGH